MAVLLPRPCLEGGLATLQTEHDSLSSIFNLTLTELTSNLIPWAPRFSQLAFNIVHLTGITHQLTDAIMGLKTTGMNHMLIEQEIPVLCMTPSIPAK